MTYAKIEIAPSILASNLAKLADEVKKVEDGGADVIHFDVMDGHFVPNLSLGIPVLESLRKTTRLPLDVHLMIERPEEYIVDFNVAKRVRGLVLTQRPLRNGWPIRASKPGLSTVGSV